MIECAASARFSQTFLNLTETYPNEFITLDEEELVWCGPAYKRQEFLRDKASQCCNRLGGYSESHSRTCTSNPSQARSQRTVYHPEDINKLYMHFAAFVCYAQERFSRSKYVTRKESPCLSKSIFGCLCRASL